MNIEDRKLSETLKFSSNAIQLLDEITIGFESAYCVEGADFIVPDTKINNYNAFDSIDLSYYHQKCK